MMDLELQGKRALVLAGGKGIGAAIAAGLAAEGAEVCVVSRSEPDHAHQGWIQADLASDDAADTIVTYAKDKLQDVDILVLNSGGPPPGVAQAIEGEAFARALQPMFVTQVNIVQAFLPGMKERGFGRVLAVASSSVVEPIGNLVLSNSIRAGLGAWCKTLAAEVARYGINVNMMLPGRIGTDRLAALHQNMANASGQSFEDIQAVQRAEIPVGRFGEPVEFANVATFLASPKASYITGSQIRIDGGLIRSL